MFVVPKPKRSAKAKRLIAALCLGFTGVFFTPAVEAKCEYCDSLVAAAIRKAEASIVSQLIKNAKDMNTGLNAIVSTVAQSEEKAAKAIIDALWEIYRRRAEFEAQHEKVERYGDPTGVANRHFCESMPKSDPTVKETDVIAQAGSKRARTSMTEKDFIATKTIPEDKIDAATLFDSETSAELRAKILERMTAFYDPLDIDEALKENTDGGKLFVLESNERKLKLDAQAEVMRRATARFNRTGSDSFDEALEKAVVEDGYPSEQFRQALASANDTNLLRSAILMASLRNVVLAERYEMKLRNAVANATYAANAIDSVFKARLNAMRAAAYANAP